jgi:hypothetical protein
MNNSNSTWMCIKNRIYCVIFILINLLNIENINAQICSGKSLSEVNVPIDLSIYNNSTYTNLFIYFDSIPKSITIKPELNKYHLKLTGDFGNLILDANVNYVWNEREIMHSYKCNEIRIVNPSINKFWGSQFSDFELMVSCQLNNYTNPLYADLLKNKIIISLPVINIDAEVYDKDDSLFFTTLVENFKSKINIKVKDLTAFSNDGDKINYSFSDFQFDQIFLNVDIMNTNKKFYFFNGNDVINCNGGDGDVTWIMINKFLKISNTNSLYLKELFKKYEITSSELTQDYYKSYSQRADMPIYRNFYINTNYEQLEELMMSYSDEVSKSQYLKVFSKIVFIILIIVLYE